jgi:hypothetical protein
VPGQAQVRTSGSLRQEKKERNTGRWRTERRGGASDQWARRLDISTLRAAARMLGLA